jgi:potassium-transporting ATPase KdpC subunit
VRQLILSTLRYLAIMILMLGILYPALVQLAAQVVFPEKATGSLVRSPAGEVIGSELVGQFFDHPAYFWSRPSATSPHPYNGASSSGSNLAPSNPTLEALVAERVALLQSYPPGAGEVIPVDLVTASASGLDPHISPAAAYYQVPRVAAQRGIDEQALTGLIASLVEPRFLWIFGEPRVNVLLLNLGLDQLQLD